MLPLSEKFMSSNFSPSYIGSKHTFKFQSAKVNYYHLSLSRLTDIKCEIKLDRVNFVMQDKY